MAQQADTPTPQPPTRSERFKAFIGDLARPFAMYGVAGTTSWGIFDHNTDATKLGAAGLILAALYGAKSYENGTQAKQTATVQVAQAQAAPPVIITAPTPAPAAFTDTGELPPHERIG